MMFSEIHHVLSITTIVICCLLYSWSISIRPTVKVENGVQISNQNSQTKFSSTNVHMATNESRVVGFWNIFAKGPHYKRIVDEQKKFIMTTGLLDKVDVINYLTWGFGGLNLTFREEKFHHLTHQAHGDELDTLNHLYKHCKSNLKDKVFYFHNKGSFHHDQLNEDFRFTLNCFNLNPHCIAALNEFDTCGFRISPIPHPHYSGNFWWATCEHVSKLISPYSPRHNQTFKNAMAKILEPPYTKDGESSALGLGRFFAETWLCSAPHFRPADCLDAVVDSSYVYGYHNLTKESISNQCPGHRGYGMKCGLASTMVSSAKFQQRFYDIRPIPWKAHLLKLVDRSMAWYGQPPHTLLQWIASLTDDSDRSQLHPDGTLLKVSAQPTVYLMDSGRKHPFVTNKAFVSRGFNISDCKVIDFAELAKMRDGRPLH